MPDCVPSPTVIVTALSLLAAAGCASDKSTPTPTVASVDAPDDPSARVPGAIVVDFKDGTSKAQFDAFEKEWGVDLEFNSIEGTESGITVAVGVDDVPAALRKIRQHPAVEAAEPLMEVRAPEPFPGAAPEDRLPGPERPAEEGAYTPNDPLYQRQWNLRLIHMPAAWNLTRGKGVVVAVLDTGIAYENFGDFKQVPDLKGAKFAKGYDFVNDTEHPNDDHGHGTHVAGTIAQTTNNGEGVAGVAFEATLMPVKVLNHFGSGTSADIADAIRWASDHGAKVVNLSLGGGGRSQVMESAVTYARKKGTVVVCAAGNSGVGHVEYPAAYPGSVAVAAVGPDGTRAPYSSYGKELDIAAPGGDKRGGEQNGILQNTIDPRDPAQSVYSSYQGTSMATPHVSAVAALLYASGAKDPDEVEQALFSGAKAAAGQRGWNDQVGHGLLNAEGSLQAMGLDPSSPGTQWSPLLWAAGLLALVLLSLGAKQRPGYLNLLVKPGFLVPMLLATVGLFFVGWLGGGASAATLPIPDWQKIIFGRGKLANPLFYSALIPIAVSFLGMKWRSLRPTLGGLAIGFAGFLAYTAWAKAPALAYLPFTFIAIPWLAANALVCLLIARAMLKKEAVRR